MEEKSILSLNNSKENLKKLQIQLDDLINEIENYIDSDKKLSKDVFSRLKELINKILIVIKKKG